MFPATYINPTTPVATAPNLGANVYNVAVFTPDARNPKQTFAPDTVRFTIASANITFAPATLSVIQGTTASLTLRIPYVAPTGGQSVVLSSNSSVAAVMYLHRVPRGPITEKRDSWNVTHAEDDKSGNGAGIVNLRSGSEEQTSDGLYFKDW